MIRTTPFTIVLIAPLVFVLGVRSEAQASSDSLIIGHTTLKIGAAKGAVIPELSKQFGLEQTSLGSPSALYWQVWSLTNKMGPKAGPGSVNIGSVFFDSSGKVSKVVKDWTPEHKTYSAAEIGKPSSV